jgi:hypothetical protein
MYSLRSRKIKALELRAEWLEAVVLRVEHKYQIMRRVN